MRDIRQTMYEEAVGLLVANGFKEAIAREKLNRALLGEIASHARPIELALSADGSEVGVVVNRHFRACPDPGCTGVRGGRGYVLPLLQQSEVPDAVSLQGIVNILQE